MIRTNFVLSYVLMTVILFIIILAILILVHEFGHFIVAKKSGIRVDEFGLGLPPKLWGKKFGETEYTLNALPFGGFVKIFGEDPVGEAEGLEQNERQKQEMSRAMFNKPRYIQAAVLSAGISFNLIFAWILISLSFMFGLSAPVGSSVFGAVQNPQVIVTDVLSGSPAEKAGLHTGDVVLSVKVGQKEITPVSADNISNSIVESKSGDVSISYHPGDASAGAIKTATITPSDTIISGKRAIGVAMDTMGTLKLPIHLAFLEGAHTTYLLIIGTATGLYHFIVQIFTFKADFSQVTGPIGIAGVVGQASHLGFTYLLSLMALISINLAIINLVPFPALDGGRLLFVAIESIIRRPIHPKITQWTNAVGFVLLIILMLVVSGHDIIKLW